MYSNRQFLIFDVTELNSVDFSQVLETSPDTVRISVDGTKTFVKWEGDSPSFVNSSTTKQGPYTYEEIIQILNSSEWTKPLDDTNLP